MSPTRLNANLINSIFKPEERKIGVFNDTERANPTVTPKMLRNKTELDDVINRPELIRNPLEKSRSDNNLSTEHPSNQGSKEKINLSQFCANCKSGDDTKDSNRDHTRNSTGRSTNERSSFVMAQENSEHRSPSTPDMNKTQHTGNNYQYRDRKPPLVPLIKYNKDSTIQRRTSPNYINPNQSDSQIRTYDSEYSPYMELPISQSDINGGFNYEHENNSTPTPNRKPILNEQGNVKLLNLLRSKQSPNSNGSNYNGPVDRNPRIMSPIVPVADATPKRSPETLSSVNYFNQPLIGSGNKVINTPLQQDNNRTRSKGRARSEPPSNDNHKLDLDDGINIYSNGNETRVITRTPTDTSCPKIKRTFLTDVKSLLVGSVGISGDHDDRDENTQEKSSQSSQMFIDYTKSTNKTKESAKVPSKNLHKQTTNPSTNSYSQTKVLLGNTSNETNPSTVVENPIRDTNNVLYRASKSSKSKNETLSSVETCDSSDNKAETTERNEEKSINPANDRINSTEERCASKMFVSDKNQTKQKVFSNTTTNASEGKSIRRIKKEDDAFLTINGKKSSENVNEYFTNEFDPELHNTKTKDETIVGEPFIPSNQEQEPSDTAVQTTEQASLAFTNRKSSENKAAKPQTSPTLFNGRKTLISLPKKRDDKSIAWNNRTQETSNMSVDLDKHKVQSTSTDKKLPSIESPKNPLQLDGKENPSTPTSFVSKTQPTPASILKNIPGASSSSLDTTPDKSLTSDEEQSRSSRDGLETKNNGFLSDESVDAATDLQKQALPIVLTIPTEPKVSKPAAYKTNGYNLEKNRELNRRLASRPLQNLKCVVVDDASFKPTETKQQSASALGKMHVIYTSDEESLSKFTEKDSAELNRKRYQLRNSVRKLRDPRPGNNTSTQIIDSPKITDFASETKNSDRYLNIEVNENLNSQKIYNRSTILGLIEKTIPRHHAFEKSPSVSVTNDICSIHNYLTSNAFHYQQLHKWDKLISEPADYSFLKNPSNEEKSGYYDPTVTVLDNSKISVDAKKKLHLSKEEQRNTWIESLKASSVYFFSESESDQSNPDFVLLLHALLIQFKMCYMREFNNQVDIVIRLDNGKNCDKWNSFEEKVKKSPKKVRVWSLNKALKFFKRLGAKTLDLGIRSDQNKLLGNDNERLLESSNNPAFENSYTESLSMENTTSLLVNNDMNHGKQPSIFNSFKGDVPNLLGRNGILTESKATPSEEANVNDHALHKRNSSSTECLSSNSNMQTITRNKELKRANSVTTFEDSIDPSHMHSICESPIGNIRKKIKYRNSSTQTGDSDTGNTDEHMYRSIIKRLADKLLVSEARSVSYKGRLQSKEREFIALQEKCAVLESQLPGNEKT